ncbi:hypothetical protein [Aureimonas jatrophae]|uniref:Uncharacterized protein n=1 Tax=Aureimonas jatrophae TaxID=1166073 RepID=A0A1H0ITT7_9HYPH|nr:hypothetical protein [Aureimonas jatrophae]MBB3952358.1 hypothetical protein [Aureimonas jatrophae]SDO34809.1 hypothetical protein SAMN05192530_105335 [Aureimonas jatrophae]
MPAREPPANALNAFASLVARFPHRVLLAVPDVRHIPIFALGVEKARAPLEWASLDDPDGQCTIIGRDALEQLQAGRYGAYRLIDTRTRLARQTALYAPWCTFTTADHVEAFEREHPNLGLTALSRQVEAALRETQAAGVAELDAAIETLRSQARVLAQLNHCTAMQSDGQPEARTSPCSP